MNKQKSLYSEIIIHTPPYSSRSHYPPLSFFPLWQFYCFIPAYKQNDDDDDEGDDDDYDDDDDNDDDNDDDGDDDDYDDDDDDDNDDDGDDDGA